jgi:maltooligosyltrehalose trehalohydrolase
MHRFEVWAPLPKKVALQLYNAAHAMEGPDEQGWWRLDVKEAEPGANYGYLIDEDKTAYPDPRSLSQPHGVHGMSRVYDQNAFTWSDQKFQPPPLASSVIYELHIGTFTPEGTLDAAIGKLDYLAGLGITHVEPMPVASFAGDRGWGARALWRPGRIETICECCARKRPLRSARRGLQSLRPGRKLHGEVRSLPDGFAPHAMGLGGES